MVSIASSGSYAANNSTALFLLRGATPAGNSATSSPQSAAAQILGPRIGPDLDPLSMAVGEIIRIALENGGQFIVGAAFSKIEGTDGDDIIYGGPGSSVNAGAGNDIIDLMGGPGSSANGGSGNDTIHVSVGSYVNGDAGDDRIFGMNKNILSGGEGNDGIEGMSDNTIDGGSGDDRIIAGAGSTISGGTGNDRISLDGKHRTMNTALMTDDTGSTVSFQAGDGKDILNLSGTDSTLKLGDDLSTENTRIEISGNKALISFAGNDADQITVHLDSESSLTLAFADGSTWKLGYSAPVAAAAYTEH